MSGSRPVEQATIDGGREPAAAEGPAGQFAQWVAAYQSPLLRYVGRLMGSDDSQVEDLVQETFVRLHRQMCRGKMGTVERIDQWLFRVAHNLCLDAIRRRGRTRRVHGRLAEQASAQGVESGEEALGRMMQNEATDAALEELDRLPEELKQVVLLKILQGMTLRQIARVTGLSLGSVNYRLNQALATLARRLKRRGVI